VPTKTKIPEIKPLVTEKDYESSELKTTDPERNFLLERESKRNMYKY
jgi:hypothetical protein